MYFYIIAFIVLTVDQLSKYLTQKLMVLNQSNSIIANVFHLTYIHNTGAAFGMLKEWNLLFIAAGVVVGLGVIFFHYRVKRNYLMQMGLAFVLGGSLGNLIDRLRFGYVIDFLDLRIWPIFNIADTMINVGAVIIVGAILLGKKRKV